MSVRPSLKISVTTEPIGFYSSGNIPTYWSCGGFKLFLEGVTVQTLSKTKKSPPIWHFLCRIYTPAYPPVPWFRRDVINVKVFILIEIDVKITPNGENKRLEKYFYPALSANSKTCRDRIMEYKLIALSSNTNNYTWVRRTHGSFVQRIRFFLR